jgi:hypothetical protein
MEIIYTAITIFGITALLGMYLFTLLFRNKGIPKAITLIHLLFAVLALVLLVLYCFIHKTGPWICLVIFVITAATGFMLNFKDLTGKKVPKWLGILHGLLAITGFAFLFLYTFCK